MEIIKLHEQFDRRIGHGCAEVVLLHPHRQSLRGRCGGVALTACIVCVVVELKPEEVGHDFCGMHLG